MGYLDMLSSLLDGIPESLRAPYTMLKSFLTHTRSQYETKGYRPIWDSYLPVLIPAAIWLFVEGCIWMKKR